MFMACYLTVKFNSDSLRTCINWWSLQKRDTANFAVQETVKQQQPEGKGMY